MRRGTAVVVLADGAAAVAQNPFELTGGGIMPVVLRRVFSACRLWAILAYSCFVLIAVVPRLSQLAEAQTAASPSRHGHADAAAQSSGDGTAPVELLRQLADDKLSAKQFAAVTARAAGPGRRQNGMGSRLGRLH